jgi:two-component system chemotaxis sensor kinase CheA
VVSSSLISALVVQAGGQRFALPESFVNEIIRIDPQDAEDHIAVVDGKHVYQLRDKVLSIVHLERALGLEPTFVHPVTGEVLPDRRARINDRRQSESAEQSERFAEQRVTLDRRQRKQTLVVVEYRRSLFGLLIDQVEGVEEVVVRASPRLVDHVPVFGGHTVLGDGSLVMMCDIPGIVEAMGLSFVEDKSNHVDSRGALKIAMACPCWQSKRFSGRSQ